MIPQEQIDLDCDPIAISKTFLGAHFQRNCCETVFMTTIEYGRNRLEVS